jgi:biopolymer transport protein ExbB
MFSLEYSHTLIINATLWILIVFSVITWTIIVYKAWQLWLLKTSNRTFLREFWDARDLGSARKLSSRLNGPLARLARTGFALISTLRQPGQKALKDRGDPASLLERALKQHMVGELRLMESGLTLLASIGSTAPFVGLFGTVWGIMRALKDISKAGSASLDVVAGPIGEALIATAIGIAVAVPAVLAYNFFLRRSKVNRSVLEHFAEDLLHLTESEQFNIEGGN